MPTQISGYEENDASKSSALKEITVTTVGNKSGVDVNVIASVNNRDDLIGGGKVSVGTTAVEVTFASTTNSIIITADADNTGKLLAFVGDMRNSYKMIPSAFGYMDVDRTAKSILSDGFCLGGKVSYAAQGVVLKEGIKVFYGK